MMDGITRHDTPHHADKHHSSTRHTRHTDSVDFEGDVTAAHKAWVAWKSHDPAAWDAALELRDRISSKAWRQAMHEVDREEAVRKKNCEKHLPAVSIHDETRGGVEQSAAAPASNYQHNYEYRQSVQTHSQVDSGQHSQEVYSDRNLDSYDWEQSSVTYYPDQNYGSNYTEPVYLADYPQHTGSYFSSDAQYYPSHYSYMAPVIGGTAGALFDRHNRWRGIVLGSALGMALDYGIRGVSNGGFGTGYGGDGMYY